MTRGSEDVLKDQAILQLSAKASGIDSPCESLGMQLNQPRQFTGWDSREEWGWITVSLKP